MSPQDLRGDPGEVDNIGTVMYPPNPRRGIDVIMKAY
jgi:hypothetical protein